LSEADLSVRDSSAEALGTILKALGEKIFLPQVSQLEKIKMDKVSYLRLYFSIKIFNIN
jgi:hypothetical protein